MSETNKDHAEHGTRRLSDGWYAIHFCHECQQEAATDSKKLREPATCNAGHKSGYPLALWDCPVCTQLLRDQLQQVKDKAGELVVRANDIVDGFAACMRLAGSAELPIIIRLKEAEKAIREVEAALGGKAE